MYPVSGVQGFAPYRVRGQGAKSKMSIQWDEKARRYRFVFKRWVEGRRLRLTKLLPQGWSRARADKYDIKETGRLYAVASGIEKPEPLIEEAMSKYLEEVCPNLKNGKKAAQDLAHLVPWVAGKTIADLPQAGIDYAREHKHLAPATVRNRLAYLRAACRYAFTVHGIGDANALMRFKVPSVKNFRTNKASDDEMNKIIKELGVDVETAALVTLARYTVLRARSEIMTLTKASISTINKQKWIECGTTKNGDPHMVPVHDKALWALDFIPFTRSYSTYYVKFKAAATRMGRGDLWMHDKRRSWASKVLNNGGTLDDVQIGLNQKSRAAAERYAWMDTKRKASLFLGKPKKAAQ